MKTMKRIYTALAVLMLAVTAHATTRYVAATAGTYSAGSPAICTGQTAISLATFNTLSSVAPDDINIFCGSFSIAQNTTAIQLNNSGTSGHPIIIRIPLGTVFASPEWPPDGTSGAIDLGGNSYITIDGQGNSSGGGGIIEATLNGDSGATCLGGPCTLHGDSNCVEGGTNSTNWTVEGLSCIDMYVTATGVPSGGGGTCFYQHGNISGVSIHDNFLHDVAWCVSFQYDSGPSNGVIIANNQIYNVDHGIALGGPSDGQTLENVNVYGNSIHDYSNWDTPGDVWHHDGIHIWGHNNNASDTITGVNIYNNKFGGCIGQNVTAHIFIETNAGGTSNVNIYNNSLIDTCSGNDTNGLFAIGSDSGFNFYDNTLIGTAADVCAGVSMGTNVTFINNVMTGCAQLIYQASGGSFASGGLHNNIYANCSGSNCFAYPGGYTTSFAAWQSHTGQDASPSAYATSAGLNSSGVPNSGSVVIGNGANLTSLGITALNSDITSASRPSTGAWTIGAYNYGSSPPQASTPTFSPVAGTYSSTQSVTISASTGGVICYNTTGSPATNGTTGCTTGTHYTAPVSVSATETLYAVAGGTGYSDSSVGSAVYTITIPTASAPTFSPVAGAVTNPTTVTASTSTSGCGSYIYFDTSSTPTTNQTTYSVTTAATLHAYVHGCPSYADSSISSAAYTIALAATPTFSPAAGAVVNPTTVTASTSTSDGCTMYLDTSNPPTTAQSTYSVTTPVTLHAQAKGCTSHANSAVGSAAYTISGGTTYTLSTATAGTGTGTVSCSPSGSGISSGTAYSCAVTHGTGSTLTSVAGCGGSGTTTYTGTMPTSNCTVTATFALNTYTLTVSTAGTGSGSVSGTNCASGTKNYGTSVTCTETPAGGSTFAGWSGGTCSGTGSCSFTLSSNATVTATFNTSSSTLTITTASLPSGTIGTAYSFTMSAIGGTPPYTWSDPSCTGACNTGLGFSSSGAWSGTPTNAGSSTFTIQVADAASHTASGPFVLTIATPPAAGASPLLLMAMALNCNCAHQPNPVLEWILSPPGAAQSTWTQTLLAAKVASLTTACPVAGNIAYKSAASLAGNATSWTDSTETPGAIICTIDEESYISGGKTVISYSPSSGPFQIPMAL